MDDDLFGGLFDSPQPEPETSPVDYEFESEKILRQFESELTKIEQDFEAEKAQFDEMESEERALQLKLNELRRRKAEFEPRVKTFRFDIRRLRNDIDAQETRVKLDRANKAHAESLKNQSSKFDEITVDAKWRTYAKPHQIVGAHYMAAARRVICADQMGLGKTLQALMTMEMLEAKKVLVICPGDVAGGFYKEVSRWTNYLPMMLSRQPKKIQKMNLQEFLPKLDKVCVILNYEAWNRNRQILTWIKQAGFDSIIIDEAHIIKETDKLPYLGVSQIISAKNECVECGRLIDVTGRLHCPEHGYLDATTTCSSIKNVICMTGTPILNKPIDMFALLHVVAPDTFKDRGDFRREFGEETWAPGAQSVLAERISSIYIRRTMKDAGIELPPQDTVIHEIELDDSQYPLQAELLEMLRKDAQVKVKEGEESGTITITSVLALITRQRQATVWPGGIWMKRIVFDPITAGPVWDFEANDYKYERFYIGKDYQESCKLDKAVELYNELKEAGHRVVFFSQFKEALKEVKRRLGDEAVEYHGDTPPKLREEIKSNFDKSFHEKAKWQAVLCHYKTGGVGLTLTAATAMIILDEEWNEGKESQATQRILRIGQDENTQVHILRHVGPGKSIDTWLANLIENKKQNVTSFNTSVKELEGAFE